jgi:serine/threonine protein kinase
VEKPVPSSPPPPSDLGEFHVDAIVGAGYRLLRRLGRGAFGEVWSAEAPGGVETAVKIISRSVTEKDVQVERNALELTKKLRHGYLLQTHAFWATPERLLIAMELADGSLRDRYRECLSQGQTGIAVGELLPYIEQSAEAIDYLHENRLLHRDIKPENILRLGKVAKVADFGLALLLPETVRSVTVNSAGTIPYMGPEVWYGRACAASDQWSLAATYVELRAGRPLFGGANQAEMMFAILNNPPNLAGLLPAEEEVLHKALAKEHAQRFATCSEFTAALREALGPVLPRGKSGPRPSLASGPQRVLEQTSLVPGQSTPASGTGVRTGAGERRPTDRPPAEPPRPAPATVPDTASPPSESYDTLRVDSSSQPAASASAARQPATDHGGLHSTTLPREATGVAPGRPAPGGMRALVVLILLALVAAAGVAIGVVAWRGGVFQKDTGSADTRDERPRQTAPAPTERTGRGETAVAQKPPPPPGPERLEVPPVEVPDEPRTYAVVGVMNAAGEELNYRYRWSTETEWKDGKIPPKGTVVHDVVIDADLPLPKFEIEVKSATDKGRAKLEPAKWTGKGRPGIEDVDDVAKYRIKPK